MLSQFQHVRIHFLCFSIFRLKTIQIPCLKNCDTSYRTETDIQRQMAENHEPSHKFFKSINCRVSDFLNQIFYFTSSLLTSLSQTYTKDWNNTQIHIICSYVLLTLAVPVRLGVAVLVPAGQRCIVLVVVGSVLAVVCPQGAL